MMKTVTFMNMVIIFIFFTVENSCCGVLFNKVFSFVC